MSSDCVVVVLIVAPVALNDVNAPAPPLMLSAPTSMLPNPLVMLPLFKTPVPVMPEVPVRFVAVPLVGVPNAPLNNTGAPALPVLTAKAVAMPVPRPETPVLMGRPVQLDSVPL